jgi:HK97 gp10 family phage protein
MAGSFSQSFNDALTNSLNVQMHQKADLTVQIAQSLAHKVTGAMALGIRYIEDKQNFSVEFVDDVPYSAFEELGTRNRPPHPFMRPAINHVWSGTYGFETGLTLGAKQTDKKLLSHGAGFLVHKSLTDRQKQHIATRLAPVSKRYHVGAVSRTRLRVRHY